MGIFTAINTAGSGMTAERLRLDTIADNLANVNTTRTPEGGPYRRKVAVFEARQGNEFERMLNDRIEGGVGEGVRVVEIARDNSPPRLVYDPEHPDADEKGYVAMPNVNPVVEMTDMITASRAYEANAQVINAAKSMANTALTIGKSS
ncbi:MAG: flagellar basal body rod protein FlgC [Negativicutes bacterium]|nr:flagellar basal body rod protein FlgC [Negativicutes bacterium]